MKKGLKLLIIFYTIIRASTYAYGEELKIKGQGNINGFQNQICNMQKDYNYIKEEIQELLKECY